MILCLFQSAREQKRENCKRGEPNCLRWKKASGHKPTAMSRVPHEPTSAGLVKPCQCVLNSFHNRTQSLWSRVSEEIPF